MKLKYYLRGLGVGIVCTAIVMGIALSGNKKETLTDAEIIERARLLGMVMEEDSDGKNSDEKVSDKKETEEGAEQENGDSADQNDQSKDKSESGNVESSDKNSEDKTNTGSQNPDVEDGQASGDAQNMIEIEIKQGEFSDVVSRKLFQAGLISDAEKFNNYMTQKGVDDSLCVGIHLIPVGSTEDEIIEILQEKP